MTKHPDQTPESEAGANQAGTVRAALSSNIRRLRTAMGWTQESLADAMVHVGFDWSRVTVAQAESEGASRRNRRVTVEEVLALAMVLEVSVADLLSPGPISVGSVSLNRDDVVAFLVGGPQEFSPEELTLMTRKAMAEIRYSRLSEEIAELEEQIDSIREERELQ